MLIIFKKITFLIKCFLIFFILANISVSFADQLNIKKIVVNGEKRMSESFILNFLPNYPDTEFDTNVLNNFKKDLYNSGMFSNITLKINDTTLEINVKEYPVINEIIFTGNDLIDEEILSEIISVKTRDVLNENNLNDSIDNIRVEYQKIGRYLAEVIIKKTDISEGRVNLNFEINEGTLLVVKNINFEGNKNYSDSELKSNISTKEDAWYKIFGSNKFIPERLEYDKEKLREFYNRRGYIDFDVIVARGDLLPNYSGFNLNFIIDEGQRYTINKIDISTSLIDITKKDLLIKKIDLEQGDFFNSKALEESSKYLINYFENDGFNFIRVIPSMKKNKIWVKKRKKT